MNALQSAAALALLAIASPILIAQDSPSQPAQPPSTQPDNQQAVVDHASPWRVDITAWVWLTGLNGSTQARGQAVDVDASFGDLLEASDSLLAFSGRIEIGHGRFAGFLDGFFAKVGVDDVPGPSGLQTFDVKFDQWLLDVGCMYRLGQWTPSGDASKHRLDTTLDVYAGARFNELTIGLDPSAGAPIEQEKSWVDPIVGARLISPVTERCLVTVAGDIGGFGVSSDFTWSAMVGAGYEFTLFGKPAIFTLGYRAVGWDYTDGSGASTFEWDMVQHGPLLGLAISF